MSRVYEHELVMEEIAKEEAWQKMNTMTDQDIENFYHENQDDLEEEWEIYVFSNDWGSGEDKITPDEEMFWEWVEDRAMEERNG